jgi:hypothetical protein
MNMTDVIMTDRQKPKSLSGYRPVQGKEYPEEPLIFD